MTLSVDVRHRLGAFELDAAFESGGRLTALFGASGSGKTSLVNVIAGLIRPDSGRIAADGRVLVDTAKRIFVPKHRRRIGYVFQDARLFPHMTVSQNLAYGSWFAPRGERHAERAVVVELLGIGDLLDRKPNLLSGGEKQRVAIGRALLASPAADPDGRAAGVARRRAQGRDPALYRKAARRDQGADRLCQPFDRRGCAAGDRRRRAQGRQGRGLAGRPPTSCNGSTSCPRRRGPRAARCST